MKLTAVGLAAGTGVLIAKDAAGQEKETAGPAWGEHKTANAETLAKETKALPVRIGIEPGGQPPALEAQFLNQAMEAGLAPMGVQPFAEFFSGPAPTELWGLRVKLPNRPEIYLIDRGYRRWIPNPATYNNLFRDWNGVVIDIDILQIPLGPQISSGAVLAKAVGTAPIYLVDQGTKRWIVSPDVFNRYHFAWGRVYSQPAAIIDPIPVGPAIDR